MRSLRRSRAAEFSAGRAGSPFRTDRDRIAASPFFARLAGVTQVVSPAGSGLIVHNRLTHSLQVAQVARAIAERLVGDADTAPLVERLGGCDPTGSRATHRASASSPRSTCTVRPVWASISPPPCARPS